MLATLRDAVLGDFRPDLTLYLDTPEVGLKRARARAAIWIALSRNLLIFFNRTRARYLELAARTRVSAPLTRPSRWMPSCATFAPR